MLIEHAERPEPRQGGAPGLGDLAERIRHAQDALVRTLAELGAKDVRRAMLANALSATLTPAAIDEVAARDDVRALRLDREEQVTAG